MKDGGPNFCLGNTPHLVNQGEVICRQCGTLAQDTLIGPYQIKRFLRNERGSRAYLATQPGQTQPVMVKLFPSHPMSHHLWGRAWQELRLLTEAHYPAILPVLHCSVWNPNLSAPLHYVEEQLSPADQARAFLIVVYQYVPLTFQHLLQLKVPIDQQDSNGRVRRLFFIVERMIEGLVFAHHLGVIHGALEPENVLLSAQMDQVAITDFGLARLQLPQLPFLAPELVAVGKVCEQQRDMTPYWNAITEASDQYTLAALCYQLFWHVLPQEMRQRILPVLQQALQADPARRFPRVADLAAALAIAFRFDQSARPGAKAVPTQEHPSLPPPGPRNVSAPLPSASPSSGSLVLTPAQQANQLEQRAGKSFKANDYEAAKQLYLQTLNLDSKRVSALQGLADTYFALKRYKEALDTYEKVLKLDVNNSDAWFNQATIYDLLGRSAQAARSYERAEQLKDENRRRSK